MVMPAQGIECLPFNVLRIDNIFVIHNAALADRLGPVWNQIIDVYPLGNAQALAFVARSQRRVKRK